MTNDDTLELYSPFVAGKDVDTGRYEFFPFAEKMVTDRDGLQQRFRSLREGNTPDDLTSYFAARYAIADSALNVAAVEAAHQAFHKFQLLPLPRRRRIFETMHELLATEKQNLLRLMQAEGHPRRLAEWEYSLLLATIDEKSLDCFERELVKTIDRSGSETILQVRRPDGVVCVSTPRNTSVVGFMTVSALLAGNTMVIKPPLQMPVGSIFIWRNIVGKALELNDAPPGCVNVVVGDAARFMQDWLDHPDVRAICFFGQSDRGLEIGRKIYASDKKPILELSGSDCLVVWRDADLEAAATSLVDAFMASMQACMVPKKALIHAAIYDDFARIFVEKVEALRFGLPSDPDTIFAPVARVEQFANFLQDALGKDARLLTGGYRTDHRGIRNEKGAYVAPTVVGMQLEAAATTRCVREEGFVPLLPLIRVAAGPASAEADREIFASMMAFMACNPFGLRISVWVKDRQFAQRFVHEARHSGMLRINSRHIGFSSGLSVNGGIRRSGGPFGGMNHVWEKTTYLQGISVTDMDLSMSPLGREAK